MPSDTSLVPSTPSQSIDLPTAFKSLFAAGNPTPPPTSVTDNFKSAVLGAVQYAQAKGLGPAPAQQTVKPYDPSLQDKIANFLLGDSKDPAWQNAVQFLVGSRGLGPTGPSVLGVSPAGIPLAIDQAKRDMASGDYVGAVVGSTSVMVPGLGSTIAKAVMPQVVSDAVASGVGVGEAVDTLHNVVAPTAVSAPNVGSAINDIHDAISAGTLTSAADIHGAIDQAVGLPKGWTMDNKQLFDYVNHLNATTDAAVASGAVTMDEAEKMDAVTKALGDVVTKYNAPSVEDKQAAWKAFDDADNELSAFFKATSAKYGSGGTANFNADEKAQYTALLTKANDAAIITTQLGGGPPPYNAAGQSLGDVASAYGKSAADEEAANKAFDQSFIPPSFSSQSQTAQTALEDYVGKLSYKYGMSNQPIWGNLYEKLTPAEKTQWDGLLANAQIAQHVAIAAAPPSFAGQSQTALADFEGEMTKKYGSMDVAADKMTAEEASQHDQLINDVMTSEQTNTSDNAPRWTHDIENFVNRPVSDDEQAAIKHYTASSTAMNRMLGGGAIPKDAPPEYVNLLQSHIKTLDNLLDNASTPNSMVVYRGFSSKTLWNEISSYPKGTEFTNKAFTSTSAQRDIASNFGHTLMIVVPKGAKAVPFSGHSTLASEDEVLLARGTTFRVLSNNGIDVRLEVVPK